MNITSSLTSRKWLPLGALVLAAGCSSGPPEATTRTGPDQDGDRWVIVESHFGGNAPDLVLSTARWGRLVDIFGLDGSGQRVPMFEDFVISPDLVSDGQQRLVLHPHHLVQ